MSWLFLIAFIGCQLNSVCSKDIGSLQILILSQKNSWHEAKATNLKEDIEKQIENLENPKLILPILIDTIDFPDVFGAWAYWPIFKSLWSHLKEAGLTADWLLILEEDVTLHLKATLDFLKDRDPGTRAYFGHGLLDLSPTIIHHYAFVGGQSKSFFYPDIARGTLISSSLMQRALELLDKEDKATRDFTIDPKHELAMLFWEEGAGTALTSLPEQFCVAPGGPDCLVEYRRQLNCDGILEVDDVLFAVKTFHEHHKTRIVVVKRTWAREAGKIEYFSDMEDHYIPTIDLGINNTERGHCGKTYGILKRFQAEKVEPWLVITDDDTLLSVERLLELVQCYFPGEPLVLGEHYGYGFDPEGKYGYDYPTGGSSMVFSRAAVDRMMETCDCPANDSPDDMILGICANRLHIPILHSDAFHQARPVDYAEDYVGRLPPISFHRHWETDPYKVYTDFLAPGSQDEDKHQEL